MGTSNPASNPNRVELDHMDAVLLLRKGEKTSAISKLFTTDLCTVVQKWSVSRCIQSISAIAVVLGGIEAGLILGLRAAKHESVKWPLTLMAVLSATLLAAGVLRHYWDIYRHRTVRGISFIFVGIDAAGDLTSLISVCKPSSLSCGDI